MGELESSTLNVNCMGLVEKYQKLAGEDYEIQAWVFCAAAALVKCASSPEGFEDNAKDIVLSMREIVVNQNQCPCQDVISPTIWNKYK